MPVEPSDSRQGERAREQLLLQVFAFHFPPSSQSGAARPGRLARYLPGHGIRCRVTACAVEGAVSSGDAQFLHPEDARGGWRAALAVAKGLHRLAPYNEQLPWVPAALGHALKAHRLQPAQAVFSSFPPLAAHLAGLLFHLRTGVPWIADFRDPLYGNPFRNREWAQPYDRLLESVLVAHAALILVTNGRAAAQLRARYPQFASRVQILWNGFDPEQPAVLPAPATAPRRMVHAGTLYGPRRPSALIRALALLLDSGRLVPHAWRVVFVGPREAGSFAECAGALERLQRAGIIEVRDGLRPRRELDEATAAASILLLLDLTGEAESAQVPAKLFDYVRSGLPIAAWSPEGSPTREVLARSGLPCLVFAPHEPDASVAERLCPWLDNPPPPGVPSEWFLQTFDGARQAAMLAEWIRQLPAGPPRA